VTPAEVRRLEAPLVRRTFPKPGLPQPVIESPLQPPGPRDFAFWQKEAVEYNEMLLTLLPERLAEIDAVAPRLHLTPQQVERLKRWQVNYVNLTVSTRSSITTEPELDRASGESVTIYAAHAKAEIRLLGRDTFVRYLKLKSADEEGGLDQVDDNGDLLPGGNVAIQMFRKDVGQQQYPDTSKFDPYFTD
jgi:hypothetical protein